MDRQDSSSVPTHFVSSFGTPEFGADTVRIGDLNGDGAPDLLFAQTLNLLRPGHDCSCEVKEHI